MMKITWLVGGWQAIRCILEFDSLSKLESGCAGFLGRWLSFLQSEYRTGRELYLKQRLRRSGVPLKSLLSIFAEATVFSVRIRTVLQV